MENVQADSNEDELRGHAAESVQEARTAFHSLVERLESSIRARPGAALLAALGIGFVMGRLLRRGG